ncbi:uncharacterized protein LOC6724931 isoform X2 [Drosophila simulans]|uniref:GD16386 n=1 Tax=Drosophila simulans TaxID=7240 RepID=B4R3F7_DROSI|nr:uncharacterized protein LOC6724931 isoform X2 [Drosophila simulans]EDX16909.1 GD16386 [Drosophila simulans]KMZ07817.1 uncharacterized protein Dsimw501_GD16386, isoform A [Drosophila simulans]
MDISQPDDLYKEEETVRQPSLMPRDPLEVFNWIASLDVDKLEDETPPASFYFDLVETKDVELACSVNTGKLLVTLGCQTDVSQPDYSSNAALAPTDLKLSIPEGAPVCPCPDASGDEVSITIFTESESEPKPHENSERPPSRFSFFGMLVKAVLALSVVHALYVLSTIGFETFKNRVCQSSVLNMTPPQTSSIRETIASLPESIWRSVEAKIASLRARFR